MTIPSVTPLPIAMSRARPANYSAEGDAYFSAVEQTLVPELNAVITATNAAVVTVDTNTTAAIAAAQNAIAAQAAATVTANATAWVSGTTYALNVAVISQVNFQTYRKRTNSSVSTVDPANDPTNWSVQGVGSLIKTTRTTNVVLDKSNSGGFIDVTSGTFTQTFASASTLGSGWHCTYRNSGTGSITLDPVGSELIDGLPTFVAGPGWTGEIQCDGTGFTLLPSKLSTGYMKVSDRKASGTAAGGISGSVTSETVTRTLNTVEANSILGSNLANNRVTLPPGTYIIKGRAPAYGGANKAFFAGLVGSSVYGYSNAPSTLDSHFSGQVVVTAVSSNTFELTQYIGAPSSQGGALGIASSVPGQPEVYSEIEIWKVA